MIGRTYLERRQPVTILARWGPGGGPRNVLVHNPERSAVETTIPAARREQLLDLADAVSRDAERIEGGAGHPDFTTEDVLVGLMLELRATRLTIAAAIAPTEPARGDQPVVEDGWYEIKLMGGHRQRWAHLRTVTFAGRQLVEIHTPAYPKQDSGDGTPDMQPPLLEYYSPAAIFSLTPSTETDILAELQQRSGYPF